MLRLAVWNLLLFSLPFLVALIWLALFKRIKPSEAEYKIWAWSAVAGLILIFTSLLGFRSTLGVPPGVDYVPPHMKDDALVPGQFRSFADE